VTRLTRLTFIALVVGFGVWTLVAVRDVRGDPIVTTTETTATISTAPMIDPLYALQAVKVAALQMKVKREHARYLQAHHRVKQLTRTLQHTTTTREAIDLACRVYGSCSTLWRRAQCESGGYRFARNPSGASGLFQFLPSTWATTPFASLSIWSPYAQALAAGWMQTHGRGGEWVCQ